MAGDEDGYTYFSTCMLMYMLACLRLSLNGTSAAGRIIISMAAIDIMQHGHLIAQIEPCFVTNLV